MVEGVAEQAEAADGLRPPLTSVRSAWSEGGRTARWHRRRAPAWSVEGRAGAVWAVSGPPSHRLAPARGVSPSWTLSAHRLGVVRGGVVWDSGLGVSVS